nr:MAG TPA: hypothetical protein [Caudoviricetes sp.]DAQ59121.1 MAG TPA: hypothetical protein [Caudoviricetes sp.]DAX50273.1 MAG TPA: hypothetical protein [Caudoviricetes sp.]
MLVVNGAYTFHSILLSFNYRHTQKYLGRD